jgi:hypothetical protein
LVATAVVALVVADTAVTTKIKATAFPIELLPVQWTAG